MKQIILEKKQLLIDTNRILDMTSSVKKSVNERLAQMRSKFGSKTAESTTYHLLTGEQPSEQPSGILRGLIVITVEKFTFVIPVLLVSADAIKQWENRHLLGNTSAWYYAVPTGEEAGIYTAQSAGIYAIRRRTEGVFFATKIDALDTGSESQNFLWCWDLEQHLERSIIVVKL